LAKYQAENAAVNLEPALDLSDSSHNKRDSASIRPAKGMRLGEIDACRSRSPLDERRHAKRFDIQTALRFRGAHETKWREATTVNISENGVLFRTAHPAAERSSVVLSFELSMRADRPGTPVTGRGVITRQVCSADKTVVVALAAAISKFRFIRPVAEGVSLNTLMAQSRDSVSKPARASEGRGN
jgi:hypothetical protein